jgi:hypothetical protein
MRTASTIANRERHEEPRRRRWLRLLLCAALLAMLLVPSCAPGFDPVSKVNTLRILAVTADKPYAQPGEEITLRMTLYDGFGAQDPESGPRTVQIVWIGGCFNPQGDQYFLCFPQLAEVLGGLAQQQGGGLPDSEFIKVDLGVAASSGTPDLHEFTVRMPDDIVSSRPKPAAGSHYGIAYVFFAACAGQLAPAALESPGGGEVPDFPLECRNSAGEKLGSDSFVIGYTQMYAFADARTNDNPPIDRMTIDGAEIPDDPAQAPVVEKCPVTDDDRRDFSCGSDEPTADCKTYKINAVVGDVAELDPEGIDGDGEQLRELVWLSYFAEAGDIDKPLVLASDAVTGFQGGGAATEIEWIPPDRPGTYNIWAVARDQRGGGSIVRRTVVVE